MSGRSKLLTWALPIVGAATLIGGTGMVIQNRPVTPDELPPRQPTTAPSTSANIDASVFIGAIGISEPAGRAHSIAAHTAGVVERILVNVGDRIEPGAPLFTVDTTRTNADIALRRAELDVRRGELESLRASIPALRAAVSAALAAQSSADADRRFAESELADRENLLHIALSVSDPRAISREEVDRRRYAVNQAQARVSTANAAIERARAGVVQADAELARYIEAESAFDGPELRAAVARIEQAQRTLDRALADLALLTVRSPIAAEVLQVNIRTGEYAPASVPAEGLVVLGAIGVSHLRVEIDEVDIPRFAPGAKAWASPRGAASIRIPLGFVHVEPLVVPKRNLSGRTSELIDTRVMQVVYEFGGGYRSPSVGQQFDVYIAAVGENL